MHIAIPHEQYLRVDVGADLIKPDDIF